MNSVSIVREFLGLSSYTDRKRFFTFGPKFMFSKMMLLDGNPRSAQVAAEENAEVYQLTHDHFEKLCRENSAVAVKLLQNIGVVLTHRLRVRSEEVWTLEEG